MGDAISSHLDEGKREMITARTGEVIGEFGRLYEKQYTLALFNKVRFEIEGSGGPQPQLLHRKLPLQDKSIFSGTLFQFLEENKKWRNRFLFVPNTYNLNYYESKLAYERGLQPKGIINCAGYKALTSMDAYLELLNTSLPDVKAKVGSSPFLKCITQFPLILWHPYARHYYFCVGTEKEQHKWHTVFQDCVRHTNNGLSEECKVQTPAFTDAVRLYRQAHAQYGTWDMMCGSPPQILANLVMETLLPEMKEMIAPRLKGKMHDRQRSWMLISDAVYGLVQNQAQAQYEAMVQRCEAQRPPLEASIRTDMDQIITAKEHVTSKIRALVMPKAEKLLKVSIQPYINSILEALMEPTSRGFSEVRDVFFRELVEMSKNSVNDGNREKLGEHMEKLSMLAFHPVKMQSCYEKVEQLSLEGLQQRFDVSSPSVFVQRAQILMREQMDDAVYTFETLLHQSLEGQGDEDLCKMNQRCQDRVLKKFDYDSSTVRKRFFREALLQIFIPYMLKQLSPTCVSELPHFQEMIFEDFSRFILVENIFEEVVLQSVMKDIMLAVKEAAVQRRHNLYRDSIVLTDSDPSLHLLGENPPIDWAGEFGEKEAEDGEGDEGPQKRRRMKQVVSMIQVDGSPLLSNESCLDVPGVDGIQEEVEDEAQGISGTNPKEEERIPGSPADKPPISNGTTLPGNDAVPIVEDVQSSAPSDEQQAMEDSLQDLASKSAIESAIQEIDDAVQEEDIDVSPQELITTSPPTQETAPLSSTQKESVPSHQEIATPPTQETAPPSSTQKESVPSRQEIATPSTQEVPAAHCTEKESISPQQEEVATTSGQKVTAPSSTKDLDSLHILDEVSAAPIQKLPVPPVQEKVSGCEGETKESAPLNPIGNVAGPPSDSAAQLEKPVSTSIPPAHDDSGFLSPTTKADGAPSTSEEPAAGDVVPISGELEERALHEDSDTGKV